MGKEDAVHICSEVLVIKKNNMMSFAVTWMDLETDTYTLLYIE